MQVSVGCRPAESAAVRNCPSGVAVSVLVWRVVGAPDGPAHMERARLSCGNAMVDSERAVAFGETGGDVER